MREGVLEEVDGLRRRRGGACEGQECGANTARERVNSFVVGIVGWPGHQGLRVHSDLVSKKK